MIMAECSRGLVLNVRIVSFQSIMLWYMYARRRSLYTLFCSTLKFVFRPVPYDGGRTGSIISTIVQPRVLLSLLRKL